MLGSIFETESLSVSAYTPYSRKVTRFVKQNFVPAILVMVINGFMTQFLVFYHQDIRLLFIIG